MKPKHIITAVLLVILPFVVIISFGELGAYLQKLASRTYVIRYSILGMLISAIPTVIYIFWLSFAMRTKYRPAKLLLSTCCCFAVAATLIACLIFMLKDFYYGITFAIIAANLFAGLYMLCKGKNKAKISI